MLLRVVDALQLQIFLNYVQSLQNFDFKLDILMEKKINYDTTKLLMVLY